MAPLEIFSMDEFFKALSDYKYEGQGAVYNWQSLENLFALFPEGDLSHEEDVVALNLVLESCRHMEASCYVKAFDLDSDLRNRIQEKCRYLVKSTNLDLKKYLLLLVEEYRLTPDQIKLSGLDRWISAAKPWDFYLVEGNSIEPEVRIFNRHSTVNEEVVMPNPILLRNRKTHEQKHRYISDIVEKENIKFWLSVKS